MKDNFNCLRSDGTASKRKKMDFENWYIKKLIGRGGYGKVYLITHQYADKFTNKQIKKDYALKVYKKCLLLENDMCEHTFRERNALLELDHPFILNMKYSF